MARYAFLCMVSILLHAPDMHADGLRKVLISTDKNIRVDHWKLSSDNLPALQTTPWSIEKRTLHGGKQEGVDLVVIDSGGLAITLVPTRGMSILRVKSADVQLGWNSPVEEVVHPRHINLQSRGGLGWLDGFNEWMVRCGLEFAGHPGPDTFVNNTGDTATMDLSLHGKVGNIPASEVEVLVDPDPPHRIRVRGTVYEQMFYGPKLKLDTEVSVVPGQQSFRIADTVTNLGAHEQEFQIIYHGNYGPPLLGKGATLVAPLRKVAPMNDHAAEAVNDFAVYQGPTKGFVEEVYLAHPIGDESNRTTIMLRNSAGDLAASMTWSLNELPYLTVWKNTAAEAAGYVTGLEPGTGFPFNRSVERKFGRVPRLAAGASRKFSLDFNIIRGRSSVANMQRRIGEIQGNSSVEIDSSPPAVAE